MTNTISNTKKFLSEQFSLSDREIALYFFFLKNGPSTILEASEDTGINRSTVHINVESLGRKGFITQTKKGKGSKRLVIAEPPEKLSALLQQKKSEIEIAEQHVSSVVEELSDFVSKEKQNTSMDIRYYRGKNEVRFIYEEALKAKEFRSYVNGKKLTSIFPNNPQKFINALNNREDMYLWEILEDSEESRHYANNLIFNKRYECRLAPKHLKLSIPEIDYMIFDKKVAVVDFEKGVRGMIVQSTNFYNYTKAIFEFIWQMLKPYEG